MKHKKKPIYLNNRTKVSDISKCSVRYLVKHAAIVFQYCKPRIIEEVYFRVWTVGNMKDAKDYLANQYYQLKSTVTVTEHLEVCAGAREKDVQKAIENAAYRIGICWTKRRK